MPTPSRLQYSHRFTFSKGTICAERNRKPLVRDSDMNEAAGAADATRIGLSEKSFSGPAASNRAPAKAGFRRGRRNRCTGMQCEKAERNAQ